MKHYYTDVPRFGNVALSHHSQKRAESYGIIEHHISQTLYKGKDFPDVNSIWREHNGVRLVIIQPTPWVGAWLVKTIFRIEKQAKAK